jgi:hypothetical protein
VGGIYSAHEVVGNAYRIPAGNLKRGDHLKDEDVNGK